MRIALFGKTLLDADKPFVAKMLETLENNGIKISVYAPFASLDPTIFAKYPTFVGNSELRQIMPDMLLSIGGDGTMLDTLPLLLDTSIPVIGINTGRLGFLSTVPKNNISEAVSSIAKGDYTIEYRTVLQLLEPDRVFDGNNFALNEFAITRHPELSLLSIKVFVNDVYLNTYWGDGILVATPTGSTAYSLSAGGPIITPDSHSIVITPLAAHNLTIRPLVMPDDSIIRIIVEGRGNKCVVSLDSQTRPITTPMQLILRKAAFKINTVQLKDNDFFTTIRNKLMWGKDNRN